MTQYEILKFCYVEDEDVPKFTDSQFWLDFFPEKALKDLKDFGMSCDFRRSFITTDRNPYYNSFIEWQFFRLKSKDVIKFGKRPSIYCPKDG